VKTVMKVVKWVLIGLFVLSLFTCTGAFWIIEIPVVLAIGWIHFLMGVLPEVTFQWGAIAETLAVAAALGVGTHLLLRRLWRQLRAEEAESRPWPVRWSVSLVSLVVLLFSATMATVGIGHQVGWLMSDPEPLLESSWRVMMLSRRGEELCLAAVRLAGQGVPEARVMQRLLTDPDTRKTAELMHVARLQGPGEGPLFVVFPRDPIAREEAGGQRCGSKYGDRVSVSASELPKLLTERRVAADTPP